MALTQQQKEIMIGGTIVIGGLGYYYYTKSHQKTATVTKTAQSTVISTRTSRATPTQTIVRTNRTTPVHTVVSTHHHTVTTSRTPVRNQPTTRTPISRNNLPIFWKQLLSVNSATQPPRSLNGVLLQANLNGHLVPLTSLAIQSSSQDPFAAPISSVALIGAGLTTGAAFFIPATNLATYTNQYPYIMTTVGNVNAFGVTIGSVVSLYNNNPRANSVVPGRPITVYAAPYFVNGSGSPTAIGAWASWSWTPTIQPTSVAPSSSPGTVKAQFQSGSGAAEAPCMLSWVPVSGAHGYIVTPPHGKQGPPPTVVTSLIDSATPVPGPANVGMIYVKPGQTLTLHAFTYRSANFSPYDSSTYNLGPGSSFTT